MQTASKHTDQPPLDWALPGQASKTKRGIARARRGIGLLAIGALLLLALVSTGCGSTTTATRTIGPSTVTIALTSPSRGSVVSGDRVTVRGTVSPANAAVQIQGQPAAVGNGVFTGSATLHGGKTTIDVVGSASGATPVATSVDVSRPRSRQGRGTPRAVSTQATPSVSYAGSYSSGSSCGGGLSVGANTTCAFAENVRSAYDSSGPGTVMAYSPVTTRMYAMSCSTGPSVVCTGGDNASVYFPAGSAGTAYEASRQTYRYATPASAPSSSYSGQTSCGGDLSVGANTTCAFAENVRSAYDSSGPGTVMAYSPVTNKTYAMTCSSGSSVVCTGGNHASVYFP